MNKRNLHMNLANLSLLCLALATLVSCNGEAEGRSKTDFKKRITASIKKDTVKKEEKEPRRLVTYHLDSLGTKAAVDSFKTRYDKEQQSIIYALNRMDPRRLNAGDQIVIPDSVTTDLLAYAPFPEELDLLDSIPKTVLISRRVQAVALYKNGELVKWGPASTGKESTQTPTGLYYGNYKAKRKISTIDKDWIMPYYFNFMNYEGIGTHEYTLPGYPASHGCVRLRNEEATYIYNWADQWKLNSNGQVVVQNGTPFMVFGDYDFEHPAPWLNQAADPRANFLSSAEMQTLREYVKRYQNNAKNVEQKESPEGELNLPPKSRLQTIN